MNPGQFNSKIYGYRTSEVVKKQNVSDTEMKKIVDGVLEQMNTQPQEISYYDTSSTYTTPVYNKKFPQKKIEKKNTTFDFTPEFYNVLKSMISKEVMKQNNENIKKTIKLKDSQNQTLSKRLNYYEKKMAFLEEQILLLKNNFS